MSPPNFDSALARMISQLPSRAVRRLDGWHNTISGLGQSLVDKVRHTVPTSFHGLDDGVLADLFHSDATVRKAVTKRPDDSLRLGFRVSIPKEAGGHETATRIQDAADDLDIVQQFRRACYWEQLFGGAVLYIAVDDGQYAVDSQALPINRDGLRRILWVKAIDRTRVRPSFAASDLDPDPDSKTYGEPLYYLLDVRGTGAQIRVHKSRVIVFPSAVATDYETRARNGWGISIIDPVYEALQRNATAWSSAATG